MKIATRIALIIVIIFFSWRLFFMDQAALPQPLIEDHARNVTQCNDCHTPWQGVDEKACMQCHEFEDYFSLRPAIRFHQTGKYCLKCHTEHLGSNGEISKMDHTLLNDQLLCADCHLDPHQGLFGRTCRECHGLSAWDVRGYRHPDAERKNCDRCHRPPISHTDESMWQRLQQQHKARSGQTQNAPIRECWQCHVIHSWRHLRM